LINFLVDEADGLVGIRLAEAVLDEVRQQM